MVLISFTQEFTSPVAPKRMLTGLATDAHKLLPKLAPHVIKSIEHIQGNGRAGSIRLTKIPEGRPTMFMKIKIDECDTTNYKSKITLIDSDLFGGKIESIVGEAKFEAFGTGCVGKLAHHIHTEGDTVLTEEEINDVKEKDEKIFKMVEEYLMANPNVYA